MKEFDPLVILAVFQEMLGLWLWVLLLLAVGGLSPSSPCGFASGTW